MTKVVESGTTAKLMARMRAPTITIEMMPPRLSTEAFDSLTCAGTNNSAMKNATTASGTVTRNTEPQSNACRSQPDSRGPSDAMAAPMADHSAIERVRLAPPHRAAINASVVG